MEKIYKSYVARQLDETNEQIANTLFNQICEVLTSLELVEDGKDLESELKNNELLKRDVKNILSYVTPYVPLIGLACGAICIRKHILKKSARHASQEE